MEKTIKKNRVLSCVVYSIIDNYVCIDYLLSQSKTSSSISSKPKFEDTIFNILLGIGIPELLLNLVSCHGFMRKPNSTVILNFQSRLIENCLAKGFHIIEKDLKQLSLLPIDMKLIFNIMNQRDTDFFMKKKQSSQLCRKNHKIYIFRNICI